MALADVRVEDCAFTVRVANALEKYGRYRTVADLDAASDMDLLRVWSIGRKGLAEIRELIEETKLRHRADDIAQWVQQHQNLIRALIEDEAEIRWKEKR